MEPDRRSLGKHRSGWLALCASGVALAALPVGCGGQGSAPGPLSQGVTLTPFNQCADLEQYLRDTAVKEMRNTLDGEKPGNWNSWWGRGVLADGVAPVAAGAAQSSGSSQAAPTAFTTTNVQVKGVDEPDFMKNDGTRIFTLSAGSLYATKSWPPQSTALAGSLPMEGYPSSMFLDTDKNRVVVMSDIYIPYDGSPDMGGTGGGALAGGPCIDYGWGWGCGWGANATKLTVVDVTDITAMKVVDETYLPGSYGNARRVGSSVRVVLSDAFRWPKGVSWWPTAPQDDPNFWSDKDKITAALSALEDANEKIIRAAPIDEWLPKMKHVVNGKKVDIDYSCSDFYAAAGATTRLGMVTVATLDLDHPGTVPSRTTIVAEQGEVYASATSLYVASWHWWWWPTMNQSDWFYVHKFDISDPTVARYVGSGAAPGHIQDQFSMDEWNGDLRIATTINTWVPDKNNNNNPWGVIQSTNRVLVMGDTGHGLRVVGQTPEIDPGESIESARFVADKAFVVTFKQVDPLVTLDMSDRTAPRVVGSIQVPGYSTYIQPIDATHLLTMGIYLPGQPDPRGGGAVDWQSRRMMLELFDVSDFANPRLTDVHLIGSAYGWSEAAWEHKAFNWFPERGLLAIPFSDYSWNGQGSYWDSFVSDVRVFSVDVKQGIAAKGALSMKDVYQQGGFYAWDWWWSPWIRRSVMSTDSDGKDFVYAIADGGLRVANLAAIDQPLATVLFPRPMPKQ